MSPRIPTGTRAVFFDAVGTVLFPQPTAPKVYAEVAARAGLYLSPEAVRARFVEAYRIQEAADRVTGWATSEDRERARWHTIVTATLFGVPDPEACFRELYEHFAKPAAWRVDESATAVVNELTRRGLAVGLGSNCDARLWSVLDGFPELNPLRERAVVSAAVGFRKPAGAFFAEVTRAAGCAPSEVLFVGDDIDNDYLGATAAGLHALLLDTSHESPALVNRITRLSELLE